MRLLLLVALTMTAFAANSVLNRAALASGGMDALSFGTLRLLSGALVLAALVLARQGRLRLDGPGRLAGVAGLFLYIYGFSLAYLGMPAGLGALLLFGMVQVTMFGRQRGGRRARAGAALARGGAGLWRAGLAALAGRWRGSEPAARAGDAAGGAWLGDLLAGGPQGGSAAGLDRRQLRACRRAGSGGAGGACALRRGRAVASRARWRWRWCRGR